MFRLSGWVAGSMAELPAELQAQKSEAQGQEDEFGFALEVPR